LQVWNLLFPEIVLDIVLKKNNPEIYIWVLLFEDRGITIGCHGDYIKNVNKIIENYTFKESIVKIKCEVINLLEWIEICKILSKREIYCDN